jgi:hypothetical protein
MALRLMTGRRYETPAHAVPPQALAANKVKQIGAEPVRHDAAVARLRHAHGWALGLSFA